MAEKLGVFWQRRDLTQEHRHWARPRGDWRDAPDWAHKINNPQFSDWDKSKALFAARKAAGFPGHEPLENADSGTATQKSGNEQEPTSYLVLSVCLKYGALPVATEPMLMRE